MQLSDLKKAMKGVDVVQETPFNKDGSLDLEGMRANTRWLVERMAGKDFIFTPVGSNGEFYAMSDDERKAVVKMVAEEVNGKNVVMAGTAQAGTRETIKMTQYAESVGADGAQIILPYYHVPTEEGMYQHYKQIAESVGKDFGIMVYNNPDVSASWIKPPLMAKLSKIPNIIAVKENTPYIMSYYAMIKAVDPKDMAILCGTGELPFSFAALYGCPGFITEKANFAPEQAYSVYEAAAARDFSKLAELVDSLTPYGNFVSKMEANHGPSTSIGFAGGHMGMAVHHAAMDIVGLRGGEVRFPLVGLNREERAELRDVLRTMGVIK
jgi:4-hydroxy-tetrahydrodipicolinate synthase